METRTALTPEREVLVLTFKEASALYPDIYGKIESRKWRENLGIYFREVHDQQIVKPNVIANWIEKYPWIVEPLKKVAVTNTKRRPTPYFEFDPPQPVVNIMRIRIEKSDSLTAPKQTAAMSQSQPVNIPKAKPADSVQIAQGSSTKPEKFATATAAPAPCSSRSMPGPSRSGMSNATYTRRSAASLMAASAQPDVSFVECEHSSLDNAQPKVDTTWTTSKPIPQRLGLIYNGAFLDKLDIMENIAEKLNRANTTLTPASTSRAAALLDKWDSFVDTLEPLAPATNPQNSSGPLFNTPLVNGHFGNNGGEVSPNGGGSNEGSDATIPVSYITTARPEQVDQGHENGDESHEQGPGLQAFPTAPVVDVREPKMPPARNIPAPNTGSENSNFGPTRHHHHHHHPRHHHRNRDHSTIPGFTGTGTHLTADKFVEVYHNVHALAGVCSGNVGRGLNQAYRHLDRFLQTAMKEHRYFLLHQVTGVHPRMASNTNMQDSGTRDLAL